MMTERIRGQGDALSNQLSVAPAPASALAGSASGSTQQAAQLSTDAVDVAVAVTPTAVSELPGGAGASIAKVITSLLRACSRTSRRQRKMRPVGAGANR